MKAFRLATPFLSAALAGVIARRVSAAVAVALLAAPTTRAELPPEWQAWNRPVAPFRIAGNLYYVGTEEIAAYLFATPEGHIVLDGGFAETAPLIRASIEQLGFEPGDVKWLISSHAHVDHAGGLAELKRRTGARLAASRGDAPLLESGGAGEGFRFPAVVPDRLLDDGDRLRVGATTLTARVTPGHTPGCTTWTARVADEGRDYDVVFVCSVNVLPDVDLLAADPRFPDGRAAAFARAFEVLESLPVDIFLGAHASFFNLKDKLARVGEGAANPFVDPALYARHVERKRARFEELLAQQRADRAP